MKTINVCLFTAHSPVGGGGSANFRSLINNISGINVLWTYIAPKVSIGYEQGYLGHGHMGGRIDKDIYQTWRMLSNKSSVTIDKTVKQLLAIDCDVYWIVSHNEGIRVAYELAMHQKARPVHMTVNDDWAGAICARSFRYYLMANLAQKMTISALQQVSTIDVTSFGMQTYYKKISGRDSEISHRYIPSYCIKDNRYVCDTKSSEIHVGHIGSIYDKKDFNHFLDLLHDFAKRINKKVTIHMWGGGTIENDILDKFKHMVQLYNGLPEEQVIPKLAECNIVYAMYPSAKKMSIFSQTSMPTKLSSYIQAGRPILGQGPEESSLAEFLHTTNTGVLWSSMDKEIGIQALTKILGTSPSPQQWEFARKKYFGENNVASMRKVLLENYFR